MGSSPLAAPGVLCMSNEGALCKESRSSPVLVERAAGGAAMQPGSLRADPADTSRLPFASAGLVSRPEVQVGGTLRRQVRVPSVLRPQGPRWLWWP